MPNPLPAHTRMGDRFACTKCGRRGLQNACATLSPFVRMARRGGVVLMVRDETPQIGGMRVPPALFLHWSADQIEPMTRKPDGKRRPYVITR